METPEETKARNLYEVGATTTPINRYGLAKWPNGVNVLICLPQLKKIIVGNSNGRLIAYFKLKSWKHQN